MQRKIIEYIYFKAKMFNYILAFLLRRKLLVLLVISGVKRLSYIDSPERSEWHVAKPLFLYSRKIRA